MFRFNNIKTISHAGHPGIVRLLCAASVLCGSVGLQAARADNMVTDWNNEFLLITQQTSGSLVAGPPDVAREIAQVGAAMSDAVNAATGSTIASFAYTSGPVSNANASVAAAAAAYTALNNIFTDQVWTNSITSLSGGATTATSNVGLGTLVTGELNTFLTSELSALCTVDSTGCSGTSTYTNGLNAGVAAATAVNGSATFSPTGSGAVASIINGLTPQSPAGSGTPGVYVPPATRPEMFPTWGTTGPTGITSGQLSAALTTIHGPPAIDTKTYATALLQTECQGASGGFASLPSSVQTACSAAGFVQTNAQATASANAALFWNDPGTTIQPPGHWLQIADTAMTSQNSSLLQSAQLTALLGEAMNDAGIAAWGVKYAGNLWRPTTAIKACGAGGTADGTVSWNSDFTTCDTSWSSLIATPPHPDYVAGHPAFSGAAATVLADFFGNDNVGFSSTSNYYCNGGSAAFDASNLLVSCTLNGRIYEVANAADCAAITDGANSNGSPLICPITETFDSFSAASSGTNGSEFSRVVGGIHTSFSVVDALTLGNAIGQTLAQNAGLPETVPEPSSLVLCGIGLLSVVRLRRQRRVTAAA
jgi:PEP-CTERM motif